MRYMVRALVFASAVAALLPGAALAQCEGGTSVSGFYLPSGGYVPGGCGYTNPLTPQQLYPSGAQPVPSTNPALGASRLPGQVYPSDLAPVNSSDLGPAPSLVQANPLGGLTATTTGVAPATSVLPGQLPPSGTPALTGNRALPTLSGATAPPVPSPYDPMGVYGVSLPAAPTTAEEPDPGEPPAPGRGGPTVIGEERGDATVVSGADR